MSKRPNSQVSVANNDHTSEQQAKFSRAADSARVAAVAQHYSARTDTTREEREVRRFDEKNFIAIS